MARLRPRRFVHLQLRRRAQERATAGGGEKEERWFQLCNEHPGTRQRWEEKERKKERKKKKRKKASKKERKKEEGVPSYEFIIQGHTGGRKKEREREDKTLPAMHLAPRDAPRGRTGGCSRGAWTGSNGFLCAYG